MDKPPLTGLGKPWHAALVSLPDLPANSLRSVFVHEHIEQLDEIDLDHRMIKLIVTFLDFSPVIVKKSSVLGPTITRNFTIT